jgi:hypothetical protein
MARIELKIECYCSECGKELEVDQERSGKITVEPCPKYMDASRNDGYDDGLKDAQNANEGGG